MAVFRVEKNHNYTVMSNYHLRDTRLTLKSIGLLSKMLSLTDEWDYTTRGLAAICKEGVDAIGAALKELESHGYYRENSVMVKPSLNATAKERVKGMAELRDCVHRLIDLQMWESDDISIRAEQQRLNRLYDRFTEK